MPRAFISYRRDDCMQEARSLYDSLRLRLPEWEIFQDLDSIRPGRRFEQVISAAIDESDIVLVMIGDNWLDQDEHGERRLESKADYVRFEVEAALSKGMHTIPVLVEGARMPTVEQLPAAIGELGHLQAVELVPRDWPDAVDRLAEELRYIADEGSAVQAADLDLPARITEPWIERNAPSMGRAEVDALVAELRRRRWSDGWIIDSVFEAVPAEMRPPLRRPLGEAGRAGADWIPDRVTDRWLETHVPELDGDHLAALAEALSRRGWTQGGIDDWVYALANPEAMEPQTF